jgi:electron transfer flavoprotein alpha subunit
MNSLIITEHNNSKLLSTTMATINAVKQLNTNITLLIIGNNCQDAVIKQATTLPYIQQILYVNYPNINNLFAENITAIILAVLKSAAINPNDYQYIAAANTNFGKNLIPRLSACLGVEQISEVSKIITHDTFERYIYAGNAVQTVQLLTAIKCLTIRTTNFSDQISENTSSVNFTDITKQLNPELLKSDPDKRIKFVEKINKSKQAGQANLTSAKIVVAGGVALQSKENFQLIAQLADQLNAAIGASKSAVDAGFAPNSWQIGQTGKSIAPKLYIAIGISGAIQHISGIKESKIIVAINSDENAPIVKMANYSIIGDLFTIVPELIAEFAKQQSQFPQPNVEKILEKFTKQQFVTTE